MDWRQFSDAPRLPLREKENRNPTESTWLRLVKKDDQSIKKTRNRVMRLPDINYENMKNNDNMYTTRWTGRNDYPVAGRSHRSRKTLSLGHRNEGKIITHRKLGSVPDRRNPVIKLRTENDETTSREHRTSMDKSRQHNFQNTNNTVVYTNKTSYIKLKNMTDKEMVFNDTLHKKAIENVSCGHQCLGSMIGSLTTDNRTGKCRSKEELIEHAKDFMEQYFTSLKTNGTRDHEMRLNDVCTSIERIGSYQLTIDELTFGTKLAWRNAPRCIGRIQWSNLKVFDARNVKTAREMFIALCRHIKYATNNGKIRSAITVFPHRTDGKHDFRVWNGQFINYAGYRQPDGSVIGDPGTADFTSVCLKMGWKGQNGMFDVLPLVLQANGGEPELFEIPKELVLEVNFIHPRFPCFKDLGLKWFCLPGVSNMKLDCGGLEFTACPFSGWYMSTEIASRDLCDKQRYDLLEKIADNLGIERKNNASLWKDRTVVETNIAVLHSFQSLGITIVDHHTASETFMTFMQNEQKQRGGCPADWVWIVPPLSANLTDVFHQEMLMFKLKPSYEYQDEVWRTYLSQKDRGNQRRGAKRHISFKVGSRAVIFCSFLMKKVLAKRTKCTILYATETGKSEKLAKTLNQIYQSNFNCRVLNMDNYHMDDLSQEALMLFVTSTFGNGDPPENGKSFVKGLTTVQDSKKNGISKTIQRTGTYNGIRFDQNGFTTTDILQHISFSVFGLGSRAYPNFCAFSRSIDNLMAGLGARRIYDCGEGDELSGQEESFRTWAKQVFQVSCKKFGVGNKQGLQDVTDVLAKNDSTWRPGKFRLVSAASGESVPLNAGLSKVFSKNVYTCTLKEKKQLETKTSKHQTILAVISLGKNSLNLSYNPGDHVLLFASNPKHMVNDLIKQLHDVPPIYSPVKVEYSDSGSTSLDKNANFDAWITFDRLPAYSVEDLLTRFLDITSPPSQDFLRNLCSQATKGEDRIKIENLAKDAKLYNEWRQHAMPTVLDTLRSFPSLRVSPAFLITQLPLLQPRYYSISSSQEATPGEIHVTANIVEYTTPDGTKHKGLCTDWLNHLIIGEEIQCAVRLAPLFHMPKDVTVPIIMVGPGTGIAPFRSFWMQRKVDKKASRHGGGWGDMDLYFGCRHLVEDNIYKEELDQQVKENILTKCFFAYSREPGRKKTYVQDVLRTHGQDVYRKIVIEKGHFYICGNIQMASDVKETLCNIVQTWGKMSSTEAQSYIVSLKGENRLHEDIFGLKVKSSSKDRLSSKSKHA